MTFIGLFEVQKHKMYNLYYVLFTTEKEGVYAGYTIYNCTKQCNSKNEAIECYLKQENVSEISLGDFLGAQRYNKLDISKEYPEVLI